MLADIIFPHAATAYLDNIFVPASAILALAMEFAVYVYFQARPGLVHTPVRNCFGCQHIFMAGWPLPIRLSSGRVCSAATK